MTLIHRNKKGFSLVELMIVVAIIGVTAGLAIPSFQRYVNKAKRGEGEANVSILYTSMKTYFANFSQYTNRFDAIGFKPSGALTYAVGFAGDFFPAPTGPQGTATCFVTATGAVGPAIPACTWPAATWTNKPSALAAAGGFPGAPATTATSFTAHAVGVINGSTPDSMSMDERKTFSITGNGL